MAYTQAFDAPGGPMSDSLLPGRVSQAQSRALWRKRLLIGLAVASLVAGALTGTRWYLQSLTTVFTDDAYVDAPLAEITPQIDGTIQEVLVTDTQHVERGELLVRLDPADAALAVRQARANYEQALRRVDQYRAEVNAALAEVAGKQSNLRRAELGLRRRNSVSETGAVSAEEISSARNQVDAARSELSIAQQQLVARQTLVQSADAERNPEAVAAKAALDKALLDLERTAIRAPVDGVVASRHAQIGQRVKVGSTLMSVVPLMEAHVDANFKEVQLKRIRPGQKVDLTADLYGDDLVFHGRVAGLGGGTGSAFAVIPAQNATGNWIKVVQRLPVRIALDPRELGRYPLRLGVSMTAKIYLDRFDDRRPALRTASLRTAY